MKYFALLFSCILLASCGENNTKLPARITAIRGGVIAFEDGTTQQIPHYGDSTYVTFYIVRHAEKNRDGSANPGLTAEGLARATRLGRILQEAKVDRICSTNTNRTVKTAESAQTYHAGTAIETFPAALQDDWVEENIVSATGKSLLVVGHSNTVPKLLNKLNGGFKFKDIPDEEFGCFYIAVSKKLGQAEVLELRY